MVDSSETFPQNRVNSIFISYCRRDIDFVKRLDAALRAVGRDPWVDWEDIPGAEEWRKSIAEGIVGADTFVYIISPDSVNSVECDKELAQAIALNKRIVPLLRHEPATVHPVVAELNWLFFRETDDFDTAFEKLINVIDTDLEYVRVHTRLLQRAKEWEDHHRDDSYLLRGVDLKASENWLHKTLSRDPKPTKLHKNYVDKSREAEDAHHRVVAAGEKAKRMVRLGAIILTGTLGAAAVTAGLTLWSLHKLQEARFGAQLEKASSNVLQQFEFAPLPALVKALDHGQSLQAHVQDDTPFKRYPSVRPLLALGTILNNIREQNQVRTVPTLIRQVTLTSDSQAFVTAGDSSTVEIWDWTGQRLRKIDTSLSSIYSLAVSPDGNLIAVGGEGGKVEIWTLSGQSVTRFEAHTARVLDIRFASDSRMMATASADGLARLWDRSGQQLAEFTEHAKANAEVLSVDFRPGSQLLASAGVDGVIRIWDLNGNPTQTIDVTGLGVVFDTGFSPDGKYVAVAGLTGEIQVWDLQTGEVEKFTGHQEEALSVSFSADGKTLVSTGVDGTIRLWNRGDRSSEVLKGHQGWVYSASLTPDGQTLVSGGADGQAHIWSLSERGQQLFGHQYWVDDLAFSPDGDFMVTAGEDSTVKLWDSAGQILVDFSEHGQAVNGVAVSPGGQQLATVGFDDTLRLWDRTGHAIASFPLGQHIGWSVAFDNTGKQILTGGDDGSVVIWNTSGQQGQLQGHAAPVGAINFSPNGQLFATASDDKTARIWRADGTLAHVLIGHLGAVQDVTFSPDSQYIATASGDSTVKLWTSEGQLVQTFIGHLGSVNSVSFAPDGQSIASAGFDGTVRIWDVSGAQLTEFRLGKQLTSVSINPQGTQIAVAGEDGLVHIYPAEDLSLDALMSRGCAWLRHYFVQSQPEQPFSTRCSAPETDN